MGDEMNHELLKATAEESLKEAEKRRTDTLKSDPEVTTPRSKGFRIFALILAVLVVIGFILYCINIMTGGRGFL